MGSLLAKKNHTKTKTTKVLRRSKSIPAFRQKKDFVILTKEEVEKDRSSAYAYVVTA